jgi:hypothetical protein
MKGINGIQMQVHPVFLKLIHNMQDDWNVRHKDRKKDLSTKRLSLTLSKLFSAKPEIYDIIINSEINLDEE